MSFGHKNNDCTAFLGSLFQCLTTPSVRKFYQMSNPNLSWCNSKPSPHQSTLSCWLLAGRREWHRITESWGWKRSSSPTEEPTWRPDSWCCMPWPSLHLTDTVWSSCTRPCCLQLHGTTQEYCSPIPPSTNLILKLPPRHKCIPQIVGESKEA